MEHEDNGDQSVNRATTVRGMRESHDEKGKGQTIGRGKRDGGKWRNTLMLAYEENKYCEFSTE